MAGNPATGCIPRAGRLFAFAIARSSRNERSEKGRYIVESGTPNEAAQRDCLDKAGNPGDHAVPTYSCHDPSSINRSNSFDGSIQTVTLPTLRCQSLFGSCLFCFLFRAAFAERNFFLADERTDDEALVVIGTRLIEQLVRGCDASFFL